MKLNFTGKHIILILTVLLSNLIVAQVQDNAQLVLTANLNTTLSLDIQNTVITFDFNTVSDYQNGLGENGENSVEGSVYSTANWELSIKSAQDSLTHSDGQHSIPLNYVGYKVGLTGNYGSQRISTAAENDPVALTNMPAIVLTKAEKTNAGTNEDNAFEVFWEMGTGNGNTNAISLLEGNFKKGTYQTTIDFILTEIL
ncbi:MAG: hypothetical protein K9H64_04855 [Bacteroidales bacterium]|nr:hypothetical protein [Bacteroidales bacterium]MCF8455166.1 hypothetical protein [Bacteroidales bacterium]